MAHRLEAARPELAAQLSQAETDAYRRLLLEASRAVLRITDTIKNLPARSFADLLAGQDTILATLAAILATLAALAAPSPRPASAPSQAPPLPASFIPRPELDQLRHRLLSTAAPAGALVISALHAQAGNGKTVLATALAHHPAVQARFPDGILWVTLGQQPDLLPLLSGWTQALDGHQFTPLSPDAATSHLRTLLHGKAALLIIDDVWQPDHARCFLVGGDHCRVLVTTRRGRVGEALDAELFPLGVMTPDQSIALLAARLGRSLEGSDREQAARLAADVGHLPLALNLGARRIQRGATWDDLHAALSAEIADLKRLDPLATATPGLRRS